MACAASAALACGQASYWLVCVMMPALDPLWTYLLAVYACYMLAVYACYVLAVYACYMLAVYACYGICYLLVLQDADQAVNMYMLAVAAWHCHAMRLSHGGCILH